MARTRKPKTPFYRFNSSPEIIRLVVMIYIKYPLSLRNVEAPALASAMAGLIVGHRQPVGPESGFLSQGLSAALLSASRRQFWEFEIEASPID